MDVRGKIENRFSETGSPAKIPMALEGCFQAWLTNEGIRVSNLGNQPLLPWAAFEEAVSLLAEEDGKARTGDAMKSKLGDDGLPLNSIEGRVAHRVYGRRLGDSVFRRITPIAGTLVWAGICRRERGRLVLIR